MLAGAGFRSRRFGQCVIALINMCFLSVRENHARAPGRKPVPDLAGRRLLAAGAKPSSCQRIDESRHRRSPTNILHQTLDVGDRARESLAVIRTSAIVQKLFHKTLNISDRVGKYSTKIWTSATAVKDYVPNRRHQRSRKKSCTKYDKSASADEIVQTIVNHKGMKQNLIL